MDRIYLYIHDFRSSGVVRNALSYARRLASEHPTTLIAGYGDGFFRAEAERGPFSLAILSEQQRRSPRRAAIPRLRRWLRTQPAGVLMSMGVHGHPTVFPAVQGLAHVRRIYRFSNEVAGAINRVPAANETRSNLHVGGTAKPTKLTACDQEICERLGPELKKRGLIFTGIDVIGPYLTEINVTSPTGIRQVKDFGGADVAALIWDAIEEKVGKS